MNQFLQIKFRSKLMQYIKKNNAVLIALSGGQDSLCLLQIVDKNYLSKQGNKVYAIYIDHQWKNKSLNHTHHIINLIKAKNIPIAIYQMKILSLSENDARQMRYKTLIGHAKKKMPNNYYRSQ